MRVWTNASLGMYIEYAYWLLHLFELANEGRAKRGAGKNRTNPLQEAERRIDPPSYIDLPCPSLNSYYRVPATNTLRYLGFFFDARLSWSHHVSVMCN